MKGSAWISVSPENGRQLPSGAWASFGCCRARNNVCLYSLCTSPTIVKEPIGWDVLARGHTNDHLARLQTSRKFLLDIYELADSIKETDVVTEADQRFILTPARYQVAAVIQGTTLAWENRSIVVVPDGGQHHASPSFSEGAGVFCDVPLAWMELRRSLGRQDIKALYIDTDVHHCNGFAKARVELGIQDHFFIMDMFNVDIWPHPEEGGPADTVEHVNIALPFHCGVNNKDYLELLRQGLKRCATELPPVHMVFYMCDNDALKGDPLGKTNVTERAIYERDRTVVEWARERDLPLVIMCGRGYGPSSCRVARESMARLNDEYKIF